MNNTNTDTRKDAEIWWKQLPEFTQDELNTKYWFDNIETIYKAEHPPLPTTVEDKEVDLEGENKRLKESNTVLLDALLSCANIMEYAINGTPTGSIRNYLTDGNILARAAIEQANNSLINKQG